MSFYFRKVEDVMTISKSQSLTLVSIKDCTLRVPNKTTTLFLYEQLLKQSSLHSFTNRLPHLSVPRQLSIFIPHCTSFSVRLLPRSVWLNLSCRAFPWEHLCLKLSCLFGCWLLHLQVLLDPLSLWPEASLLCCCSFLELFDCFL